ncbi:MAG: hypothetical protein GY725_03650 [bacterium]|nr:hypothetical protein [bacterium]
MRNLGRNLLVGLVLAGLLGMAGPASAVGYEDSLDDCAYPKVFDVAVMRPLSFVTMVAGAVVLVFPVGPIAGVTAPQQFGEVAEALVVSPARFTFKRPLGECSGVTVAY